MAVSPTNSICRNDRLPVKKTGLYADKQDEQVENKVVYMYINKPITF